MTAAGSCLADRRERIYPSARVDLNRPFIGTTPNLSDLGRLPK
jgi:hypothetical protein